MNDDKDSARLGRPKLASLDRRNARRDHGHGNGIRRASIYRPKKRYVAVGPLPGLVGQGHFDVAWDVG